MPWENIGSCGSGELPNEKDWIVQCHELGLSYLNFIVGVVPEGCDLGIMWHEHELGDYPSIGIYWDFPQSDPPWTLINRCETLLERFDEAVSWSEIDPDAIAEDIEEDSDEENNEYWSVV